MTVIMDLLVLVGSGHGEIILTVFIMHVVCGGVH